MNENLNEMYADEKSISIMDLLLYVLRQWKKMVIAAVVLTLIVVLAGILKSYKVYQSLKNHPQNALVELTEEELQDYNDKLLSMTVYEDSIKAYQTYIDESILCKLDPNGFYKGTLNYVIQLESEEEYVSAKAICESEILGTESFEQVAKALGEDASVSKIDEVIGLTTERVASENKILMSVRITAMYDTEEGCQTMLDSLSKRMEAVDLSVISSTAGSVQKLSEKIILTSDSSLIGKKQDVLNAKNTAVVNLANVKNSFTENQKRYQEWLELEETEASEPEFVLPIPWKYAIVAALAGAVVVAGFYTCVYLFDGRIHSKEELESYMRVPVFDLAGDSGKGNTPEMLAMLLAGHLGTLGLKKVYLSGSLSGQQSQVMNTLKALLENQEICAEVGESILSDAASLQQAADCGCIVFLEKCFESKEKNVIEEISKAQFCGIKVLGVIVEK